MNEKIIKKEIIICGGGMAGLSLAYYLNQSPKLSKKSILIIEPEKKDANDRTWAFWQKDNSAFDAIVFRKWQQVAFTNQHDKKQVLDLNQHQYKLIRSIDFYDFVLNNLKQNPHIEWLQDKALAIEDTAAFAEVKTISGKIFSAEWVFDSTFPLDLSNQKNHNLLQHFKGFLIETSKPCFNINLPDMMDFSIEQKNNECRFMYILPHTETKALIEFTLFSESVLEQNEYDEVLNKYITEYTQNTDYQIIETEFGIIPMSDVATHEFPSKHVVRIGTSGGYTNPATGYTFAYTQKRLQTLVKNLEAEKPFKAISWWQKRHRFYASILLNVLQKKRHLAADIFYKLYARNQASNIFVFLDGETNFWQELKIMNSTPILKFIAATFDVFKRNIYL